MLSDYEDLPLVIVALCMDNDDTLDEFFKGSERPPFTVGFLGWETQEEVQVNGVPHFFLVDEERTLLLHARSLEVSEEGIREILGEMAGESGDAD